MARLLKLFPPPQDACLLKGLYLAHEVYKLGTARRPFVYANFVASLDGRIALVNPKGGSYVPGSLTSANDFRLFQELQAQADCLITHGGYLRSLGAGKLDDVLQVGLRAGCADIARWRKAHGFRSQPAVVVASRSLDFPMPKSVHAHRQQVYIATTAKADPGRVRKWERRGYPVMVAGRNHFVEGALLAKNLARLGYRSIYLVAGPRMLEAMLRDHMLARLYITLTHQILGGEAFHTLFPGSELGRAGQLKMKSLYYDHTSPEGAGQWFAQFDCPLKRHTSRAR
jgi:riboflavin biosynthesis pyrimidine reductase